MHLVGAALRQTHGSYVDRSVERGNAKQWKNLAKDGARATQRVHGGDRRINHVQFQDKESCDEGDQLREVEPPLSSFRVAHEEPKTQQQNERAQKLEIDRGPR